MALKLLHTADWHLGMRFPSFDEEDQRKLTRARIDVVERILDLAEHYAVDALLCAGDLFDDAQPSSEWWEKLARLFSARRWSARHVFLLPGNHDPLVQGSVWSAEHAFRARLPDFVHVVDRDDFSFELSPDAVLYAAPCRSQAGERDPALALPPREAGDARLRIGLVHGQTFDVEGCQTNFPIARDAAFRRGLDYLAIGDTHSFRHVPCEGNVPTIYPGAPEPTSFGEPDAGAVALVFFRRPGARPIVVPEAVARWRWREERCRDLAALHALCADDELGRSVLRLVLDMRVSLAEQREVEALIAELRGGEASHGRAGVLQVDDAGLVLDDAGVADFPADLPDVLRAAVARLEGQQRGPDAAKAKRALYHLYRLVREGT